MVASTGVVVYVPFDFLVQFRCDICYVNVTVLVAKDTWVGPPLLMKFSPSSSASFAIIAPRLLVILLLHLRLRAFTSPVMMYGLGSCVTN
jgi:hypothetical protein